MSSLWQSSKFGILPSENVSGVRKHMLVLCVVSLGLIVERMCYHVVMTKLSSFGLLHQLHKKTVSLQLNSRSASLRFLINWPEFHLCSAHSHVSRKSCLYVRFLKIDLSNFHLFYCPPACVLSGIDWQHIKDATSFATAGVVLDLWDIERFCSLSDIFIQFSEKVLFSSSRSEPVHSFSWGADSVTCLRFNPIEQQVLLSAASDRNLVLYDVRTRSPIRKLIMQVVSSSLPSFAQRFMCFCSDEHECHRLEPNGSIQFHDCAKVGFIDSIISLFF